MRPDAPGNGSPGHRGSGQPPLWAEAARPAHRGKREKPAAGGRPTRRLLLAAVVLGLAGLAASSFGVAAQLLPRTFSAAQRAQIMAWEVAKRWRTWPAGQIFPAQARYHIPGPAFGGGPGLTLTAQRVGIGGQVPCRAAAAGHAGRVLAGHGCQAVLRATYEDGTRTLAVTIGIAVLPGATAARHALAPLAKLSPGQPAVRAVPFAGTPAARFGGSGGLLSANRLAGPYLVLTAVGYANGRPWLSAGNDAYTRAEMLAVAGGVGGSVAAALVARPPPPRCPGSPGC
jgi:hypothetical protein